MEYVGRITNGKFTTFFTFPDRLDTYALRSTRRGNRLNFIEALRGRK